MGLAKRIVGTTVTVAILGGAVYLYADARDLVPGYLTTAPVPSPAAPFPTPPGALAPRHVPEPLAGPSPSAPLPGQQVLDAALARLLADKERVGKRAGVIVADAVTGDVLLEHQADKARTPASTLKLLTAVAAGSSLDMTSTLPTTAVLSGETLTLVGGGDMMLAAGKGTLSAVSGRAGLGDLAAQAAKALQLKGTTTVALTLDDTLFSSDTSSVWDPATAADGWAAPVTPVAVDTGRRAEGEYAPRYPDPALQAATDFAAQLRTRGITVTATSRGAAPQGATEVGRVESAPLGAIVDYMLEASDNTITEVVGRLVAVHEGLPASFDGATKAVQAVLQAQGVPVTGVTMVDCSGLADGSSIPPRTLLAVVSKIVGPQGATFRDVARGLPVGALTGTLLDRYQGSAVAGLVRAKTGSLTGVKSLAGTVMTAAQRQLVFVVLVDKAPKGVPWATRAALDQFVEAIAQ